MTAGRTNHTKFATVAVDSEDVESIQAKLLRKAAAWDALMEICGYWQDGSEQRVTLHQDDATRTCIISTGGPGSHRVGMYYKEGGSFQAALADYAEKHQGEG